MWWKPGGGGFPLFGVSRDAFSVYLRMGVFVGLLSQSQDGYGWIRLDEVLIRCSENTFLTIFLFQLFMISPSFVRNATIE